MSVQNFGGASPLPGNGGASAASGAFQAAPASAASGSFQAAPAAATLKSPELARLEAFQKIAAGGEPLGFGANGKAVRFLQGRLGGDIASGDERQKGFFGRDTERAVMLFQRGNGLAPSGRLDAATLGKLDEQLVADAELTRQDAALLAPDDTSEHARAKAEALRQAKDNAIRAIPGVGLLGAIQAPAGDVEKKWMGLPGVGLGFAAVNLIEAAKHAIAERKEKSGE